MERLAWWQGERQHRHVPVRGRAVESVQDSRVCVRFATSLTRRLTGPCLERNGNGEAICGRRPCQVEL